MVRREQSSLRIIIIVEEFITFVGASGCENPPYTDMGLESHGEFSQGKEVDGPELTARWCSNTACIRGWVYGTTFVFVGKKAQHENRNKPMSSGLAEPDL